MIDAFDDALSAGKASEAAVASDEAGAVDPSAKSSPAAQGTSRPLREQLHK
jgi:hypothetical protein